MPTKSLPRSQRAPKTSRPGLIGFILAIVASFLYFCVSLDIFASNPQTGVSAFTIPALLLVIPGIACTVLGHIAIHQETEHGWKSNLSLVACILGYIMVGFFAASVIYDIYILVLALIQGIGASLAEAGRNLH